MNLKELLNYAKIYLSKNKIEDAGIISKLLIEYIFNIEKEKIILFYEKELDENSIKRYKTLLEKIVLGVPVQYIINKQEFMNLNFYVDENVLIPQPDTEILVEEIINQYNGKKCKILDLCTGSGAIAIALAKYIEYAEIVASDISVKALQIAKLNAEKNLVHRKIKFIESDMFTKINDNNFDIIVSNPPYIKTEVIKRLDTQVQQEPSIALDGGQDGLKFYKIIVNNSYKYLSNDGKIFLEIGYDQKEDVINLLNKSNYYKDIYSKKDLGKNDRIIVASIRR
ncbi:MAG: peptide chain release factor N(5)-glutamine methyltransferase [Clostridia bacterium]|nr:peptide chain release factor N(5)-glutamine methyltransferase [Clostridia bacterium]